MDDYKLILGHEPSAKTREVCNRLNGLADQLHRESPELTQHEIWSIIEEVANAVMAKREKPATT